MKAIHVGPWHKTSGVYYFLHRTGPRFLTWKKKRSGDLSSRVFSLRNEHLTGPQLAASLKCQIVVVGKRVVHSFVWIFFWAQFLVWYNLHSLGKRPNLFFQVDCEILINSTGAQGPDSPQWSYCKWEKFFLVINQPLHWINIKQVT